MDPNEPRESLESAWKTTGFYEKFCAFLHIFHICLEKKNHFWGDMFSAQIRPPEEDVSGGGGRGLGKEPPPHLKKKKKKKKNLDKLPLTCHVAWWCSG